MTGRMTKNGHDFGPYFGGAHELMEFRGFHNCESRCYVEVVKGKDHSVVIVTDDPTSDGTSITNAAERIATLVAQKHELIPGQFTVVEHYVADRYGEPEPESWDQVEFTWVEGKATSPKWSWLSRASLSQLLALVG